MDTPEAPEGAYAFAASLTTEQQATGRGSVGGRIYARYRKYMPNKRYHRVLLWVVFFMCAGVVGAQLLYPPDRALPFAQVAKERVDWQGHDELAKVLDAHFRGTKLKLAVDDMSAEILLSDAGAEQNSERMIAQLVEYPFWQRFIPFSILWQANSQNEADVYYSDTVLKKISEEQAKELSFGAVNARLAIENGELVATAEKPGREVAAEAVYTIIAQAKPLLGVTTALEVPSSDITPTETAESLQDVRVAAEAALARQVTIQAGSHALTPDRATVAGWLEIGTSVAEKPELRVAGDKVTEFFDKIDAEAGLPAGRTSISLTDGRETSRTTGQTGRSVNRDELRQKLIDWVLLGKGTGAITATFHDVAPSVIYNSKYTATEEGLRAYVANASQRMNVHIAIQQVDGGRWSASTRADVSIPSASTYKLFVAKWLFDQIDKGLVRWEDAMLDTNVSICFDRMTIASTNSCSESWLAQAGRPNFNEYIWGLGFSRGTNFNMPVATHTTANDLQRMMLGIYDGTIIKGAHKDRLLHSLSSHPFPYGIPAGSGGKVYDKVGFLWDYVHDTAIVRHPKGTYIMTIMTKGQSYATIASLTREIERIMYP